MELEMTLAAIQQQRERDAARSVLAVRARALRGAAPESPPWRRPRGVEGELTARLRWLFHRPAATARETSGSARCPFASRDALSVDGR